MSAFKPQYQALFSNSNTSGCLVDSTIQVPAVTRLRENICYYLHMDKNYMYTGGWVEEGLSILFLSIVVTVIIIVRIPS